MSFNTMSPQKRILITGASGFIGGFLVEEALANGYEVFAGIRKSSNLQYLKQTGLKFIELEFGSIEKLEGVIRDQVSVGGAFDVVIHNAGLTKAKRKEDYFTINAEYTKNLIRALEDTKAVKGKFIFISSLAASGPNSKDSSLISVSQTPVPVTSYGKSKLEAEQYIIKHSKLPWLIIRPTNVYGPREKDIFIFFKLINRYFEPYIGLHRQLVSFIYVKDLVRGILKAGESSVNRRIYFAADGNRYETRDLGAAIKKHLQKKTFSISIPVAIVRVIAQINGWLGSASALNLEKVNELEAKNWLCDSKPFFDEIGFKPEFDLDRGVKETAEWYTKEKWL